MTPISPLVKPVLDKWLELTQSGFEFFEFGEEEEASRTDNGETRLVASTAPVTLHASNRLSSVTVQTTQPLRHRCCDPLS